MRTLLLTILFILPVFFCSAQKGMQFLSADNAQQLLNKLEAKHNTDYENYPVIFEKKDSLGVKPSTFTIRYFRGDSLVLSLDGYSTKEEKINVAKTFFDSKQFAQFRYFVIMFGTSVMERDSQGDLILKGFTPSDGIRKAGTKSKSKSKNKSKSKKKKRRK